MRCERLCFRLSLCRHHTLSPSHCVFSLMSLSLSSLSLSSIYLVLSLMSLALCKYHSSSAQLVREQRTEARQAQELQACRAWAHIHHTAAMSWRAHWSSPVTGCSLLCSLHTSSALKTSVQHQQASTQSVSRQEHTPRALSISSLQLSEGDKEGRNGGREGERERKRECGRENERERERE